MANCDPNRGAADGPSTAAGIDLTDIVALVWRRKWTLIICFAIPVGLCALYLSQATVTYKVQARVLVQKQGLPLERGRPDRRDDQFLATQAEIVRSEEVIRKVKVHIKGLDPSIPVANPVSTIGKRLRVSPVEGTTVLNIGYVSRDEREAVGVVEGVISSYSQFLQALDRDSNFHVLQLLRETEKESSSKLLALKAKHFKLRKDGPVMGDGQESMGLQRELLSHLGQVLTDSKNRRIELENHLDALLPSVGPDVVALGQPRTSVNPFSSLSPKVPAVLVGSPVIDGGILRNQQLAVAEYTRAIRHDVAAVALLPKGVLVGVADPVAIQQELFQAQVEEMELAQRFGNRHPEVRAVREQIFAWEVRLHQIIGAAPKILNRQLEQAELHERRLKNLYNEEFGRAKLIDSHIIEEQHLLDSIRRAETMHNSILAQLNDWDLTDSAMEAGRSRVNVRVLKAPGMTGRVYWPRKYPMLGACGLLGLVGGFGLIALLDRRSPPTLRSTDDIEDRLRMPVLGRIPQIAGSRRSHKKRLKRSRWVLESPESTVAEAFRALRIRLDNGTGGTLDGGATTDSGQVIQIVSPSDQEGRSMIISNLAFSFAQLGKKVAVVDADLREGILHEIFDVTSTQGLSSVLCDQMPLGEVIQRSPLAEVDVLPSGPQVTNPVELLSQPQTSKVLDSLREQYDLVLLDSPPLLAVTDASVLACQVDGLLLNLSVGRSSLSEAKRACQLLEGVGADVLGVVLNQSSFGRN